MNVSNVSETKGQFGFRFSAGDDECRPAVAFVQIYVKSSALSRVADLAISPNLITADEIDRFVDNAILALEAVRNDAKGALAMGRRAEDFEREGPCALARMGVGEVNSAR